MSYYDDSGFGDDSFGFGNDDPIQQYRTNRILNPLARQRNRDMIQNASSEQDPADQWQDMFKPTSESMTGAERVADQSGGIFYDKENQRKWMEAIQANESAPRPRQAALTRHLDLQPKRDNYEPTKMGRFAAGLTGFGVGYTQGPAAGIQAGKAQLDEPYKDARQDWMDRTGPLEYGANLEEKNVKDRTSGYIRNASMGLKFDEESRKREKDIQDRKKTDIEIKNIESEIANRDNGYMDAPFPDAKTGHMMILRKNKGGNPTPIDLGISSLAWDEFQQRKKQEDKSNAFKEREIGISGRNADANASRAKTAAGQLEVSQGNLEERKSQDAKIIPAHELEADQMALHLLETEYPKFVTTSPTGHSVVEPMNEKDAAKDPSLAQAYQMFLERYNRYRALIAAGKAPKETGDINLPKPRIPRDQNY